MHLFDHTRDHDYNFELETPSSRLDFPPGRPNVELLPQGESNQILNRLGNIVRFDFLCAHIRRDVCDQSLPMVRHDIFRRSCGDHHFIGPDGSMEGIGRRDPD
jgi:hypothetical protein